MMIYIFMWSMVGFSSFGLQAVLLNLYMLHLGFDAANIGRFLAVAQICFGFAALPAGLIGARLGPRTGLLISTVMVAGGWSLFLCAEGLPGGWMAIVLQVGLAVANMGQATMIVNGAPYLMCITQDADRFYYLSFQQAVQALLGLVGGFVAGSLPGILAGMAQDGRADVAFYRSVLWLMPLGFVFAFFALLRARPVQLQVPISAGEEPPLKPARFPWAVFAAYALVVYLAIVGDYGGRTFFNIFLNNLGLDTQQIGAMYGFNQIAPFITALSIPMILKRFGTGKTFSYSAVLLSGVLLFLSLTNGLPRIAARVFLDGADVYRAASYPQLVWSGNGRSALAHVHFFCRDNLDVVGLCNQFDPGREYHPGLRFLRPVPHQRRFGMPIRVDHVGISAAGSPE